MEPLLVTAPLLVAPSRVPLMTRLPLLMKFAPTVRNELAGTVREEPSGPEESIVREDANERRPAVQFRRAGLLEVSSVVREREPPARLTAVPREFQILSVPVETVAPGSTVKMPAPPAA